MDGLLYIAMNGANRAQNRQATTAHNLANVNTHGFRAQMDASRALWVYGGGGVRSRIFSVDETAGSDFSAGPLQFTGRALDVALQTPGWFVVTAADGREAYTRHGGFSVDSEGILKDRNGFSVMGDGGEITIPENATVRVGNDGVISSTVAGSKVSAAVGRLKLVNPEASTLVRGDDGLFRSSTPAPADPTVMVASEALEGSNVNAAAALIDMISDARLYDLQVRMMQTAQQNAQAAARLLDMTN